MELFPLPNQIESSTDAFTKLFKIKTKNHVYKIQNQMNFIPSIDQIL